MNKPAVRPDLSAISLYLRYGHLHGPGPDPQPHIYTGLQPLFVRQGFHICLSGHPSPLRYVGGLCVRSLPGHLQGKRSLASLWFLKQIAIRPTLGSQELSVPVFPDGKRVPTPAVSCCCQWCLLSLGNPVAAFIQFSLQIPECCSAFIQRNDIIFNPGTQAVCPHIQGVHLCPPIRFHFGKITPAVAHLKRYLYLR